MSQLTKHHRANTRRDWATENADLTQRELMAAIRRSQFQLCVLRTDNAPRVRDGYSSVSTRGHARAPATHPHPSICRTNVTADARSRTRVPPLKW